MAASHNEATAFAWHIPSKASPALLCCNGLTYWRQTQIMDFFHRAFILARAGKHGVMLLRYDGLSIFEYTFSFAALYNVHFFSTVSFDVFA